MLSLKDLEAVSGCKVTRPPEQADSRKEERPSASRFWTSFAAAAARATKTKSGDAQAAQDLSVPTELWAHAIEHTSLDDAARAKAVSQVLFLFVVGAHQEPRRRAGRRATENR